MFVPMTQERVFMLKSFTSQHGLVALRAAGAAIQLISHLPLHHWQRQFKPVWAVLMPLVTGIFSQYFSDHVRR